MRKYYLQFLVKKGYLVLSDTVNTNLTINNNDNNKQLSLLLKSFSSLGFTLDEKGIEKLSKLSLEDLKSFYHENYKRLEYICGVNKNHRTFYPSFPDVANISDEEFFARAILHYITVSKNDMGFMNQDVEFTKRLEVHNNSKEILTIIDETSAKKLLFSIVTNLIEGKLAIPYHYQELITLMIKDFYNELIINEIPFKENIAFYIRCICDASANKTFKDLLNVNTLRFVKTSTDLLRIYACISKGDYTLKSNVKFVSLNRCVRRLFLSILENIALSNHYMIDDLAKHDFLWKRAFEKLHVSEYTNKFPNIAKLAKELRNDDYKTYYAMVEENLNNQVELIKLLKTRPGEFARRLDMILRNPSFDNDYTLSSFKEVSNKVSTTLLLQLWEFFKNRDLYDTRVFKILTSYGTYYKETEDLREKIDQTIIDKTLQIIEDILSDIYSNYEQLGKVYIDENTKDYCLPINSRNASAQRKTLTFGTKIKIQEENVDFLRFFTHFKNFKGNDGRVDIDLSMEFFNEKFETVTSLSWHNLGGGRKFDSYHSGDITSAPHGASEFIDLNYKKASKFARYAVVTNCVYTGQEFSKIPECFSGVMFVPQIGKKGIVYNPEFIKYMFDLTQNKQNQNIAFALDLKTLELIWIDCPISNDFDCIVASGHSAVKHTLMNALKTHMSLYDFIMLHKKRFTIVENKEYADIIISDSIDANFKPFDVEEISAKWL